MIEYIGVGAGVGEGGDKRVMIEANSKGWLVGYVVEGGIDSIGSVESLVAFCSSRDQYRLASSHVLVKLRMREDLRVVGGFGGSRLRAKIFGLRCCIAFGSVASFPSAPFLHFIRFGRTIEEGL